MAQVIEELTAVIGADTSGFNKGIKGVMSALGGLGDLVGGLSIAGMFTAAIKEASGMEDQMAQLDARLKSTGGTAGVTRKQALDLASAFQRVTRYSDDTVLSAENLMLTFTRVGKDVFPASIEAALNMSAALGQDLNSSVMQLGKALNDPIGGMSALQRVGVAFSAEQERQIRNFVATNQIAKAQGVILKELETEFGGAAKAAGNTFAGKLDILKNKLADIMETIGSAALPVLTDFITGIGNIIDTLDAAAPGLIPAAVGIGMVAGALHLLAPLAALLAPVAAPIIAIVGAIALLKAGWDNNWLGVQSFFGGLGNQLAAQIARAQGAIQQFVDILSNPFAGLSKQTVNAEVRLAKAEGMDTSGLLQGFNIGDRISMAMQEAGPKVAEALGRLFRDAFALIGNWISTSAWPTMQTGFNALGMAIGTWFSTSAWPTIQGGLTQLWASITGWITGGGALSFVKSIGDMVWSAVVWLVTEGPGQFQKGFITLFQGIQEWLSGVGAGDIVKGVGDAVAAAAKWLVEQGVPAIAAAFQKIVDKILEIAGQIVGAIVGPIKKEIEELLRLGGNGPAPSPGGGSRGFASGGYTGDGPANGIAGVVHYGEFVVPRGGALVAAGGNSSAGGAGGITINGPLILNGVQNVPQLYNALQQEARRRNS